MSGSTKNAGARVTIPRNDLVTVRFIARMRARDNHPTASATLIA